MDKELLRPTTRDLTGQRFGRVLVLEFDSHRKSGRPLWKCQCDCGAVWVASGHFTNKKKYNNGHNGPSCRSCAKTKDLTGQRFGKIVVLGLDGHKRGKSNWKCKCDCGHTWSVLASSLTCGNNRAKSCKTCRHIDLQQRRFKDLTGQKFNNWTVIAFNGWKQFSNGRKAIWLCKCKCGKQRVLDSGYIKRKKSNSCRLCKRPAGELSCQTKNLLNKRFGRWLVIGFGGYESQSATWKVKCECGKEHTRQAGDLISGHSKGCSKCHMRNVGKKKRRVLSSKYFTGTSMHILRSNARVRDIEVKITNQDLDKILEKQNFICCLSGVSLLYPSMFNTSTERHLCTASADRIDSSGIYEPSNVQIIHKDLQSTKMSKSNAEVIEWSTKIVAHAEKAKRDKQLEL